LPARVTRSNAVIRSGRRAGTPIRRGPNDKARSPGSGGELVLGTHFTGTAAGRILSTDQDYRFFVPQA
jgi:hypothetical protein